MAKRCRRVATQAYDVWSWRAPKQKQTPRHYEICDRHARLFEGSFDRTASEQVREKCGEGVPMDATEALKLAHGKDWWKYA